MNRQVARAVGTTALGALLLAGIPLAAQSDGTEDLGPPGIPIADGTAVIASGVGLSGGPGSPAMTGSIDIQIPVGASVEQVLLYWEGNTDGLPNEPPQVNDPNTLRVDGIAVDGDFIGGFLQETADRTRQFLAYRADITSLGLIGPGDNSVEISGLSFGMGSVNNGAGMIVIIDDGGPPSAISIRDGSDRAFNKRGPPEDTTKLQTFGFSAAAEDRIGELILIVSDVEGSQSGGPPSRGSTIEITTGVTTSRLVNLFMSGDGEEWDTVTLPVTVPAGETEVAVQVFSTDGPDDDVTGASLTWLYTSLTLPTPTELGDRVWEDIDNDGVQNCVDTNMNGILGDRGDKPLDPDKADECADAGISNVEVQIGQVVDDVCSANGEILNTDENGFYLFTDLVPNVEYCVQFALNSVPADFCKREQDGVTYMLGAPQFTDRGVGGNDETDSDADPESGSTDGLVLAAGESNRSLDAGIVCPAKIGDRVWIDEDENGRQDDGEPGAEKVKVELYECGPDGIAGTGDDVDTREMRMTDAADGMYMFGAEPNFDLPPGDYYVKFVKPDGSEFTTPNAPGVEDGKNSVCLPPDGISSCVTLASGGINLARDCGLIEPQCGLGLNKECRVETPPVSGDLECEAKIAATVLEFTGSDIPTVVSVTGKNDKATVEADFDPTTGILTVDARPEDLGSKMTITTDGVEEVIHTSCSAPYVAGQPAPLDSPKGAPSQNWFVLSFVDKEGRSVSLPGDDTGMYADGCTIEPGPAPSCETAGKPKDGGSLTFRYSGGSCSDSNNSQDNNECSGSVDPNQAVSVSISGGASSNPSQVDPGEAFTVTGISESNTDFTLSNSGGTQSLTVHTSCSQPLNGGDVYGALTLEAINGQGGGADITYRYTVTNSGAALANVSIVDDKLGLIGVIPNLAAGATESLTAMALINATTTNVATATGALASGAECSISDSVTVEAVKPSCKVGVKFKEVKDDAVKYELTNSSSIVATLNELVLSFPSGFEAIKEVKLDGGIFKSKDSSTYSNGVPSGQVIESNDWTEAKVGKRQLDPGEKRTLEIKFTEKLKDASAGDFNGMVSFAEGCDVEL